MIASIVKYQDHASSDRLLTQQPLEKAQECCGVEDRAHHSNELTTPQVDRAETSHGLASRGMLQDRVLDFRRYPHPTTRAVLLEVTFIQAPQIDVGAFGQTSQFFYHRDFQWIGLGDLWTRLAQSKAHLSKQPLPLPHTQAHSELPSQVFGQNRAIPQRGGQTEVTWGLAQMSL